MKIHSVVAAVAMVACVSIPGAVYAAPVTSVKAPVNAFFGNPHKMTITLCNDSQAPLTLKVGDSQMTIEPGKESPVKLLLGEKVVAVSASADHAAGEVIVVAADGLENAKVHIK